MDGRTAEELLRIAEEASASLRSPRSKAALEDLEGRYDELVAAIQWFIDQERTDEALRITNALYRFWITKQRFEEGAHWFDRVLDAPDGDARLRGQAFIHAGFMPFWMGQDDRAAALFGSGLRDRPRAGRRADDVAGAGGACARCASDRCRGRPTIGT